ncbi:D-alanyl-D-alanine carboxypeptidase family protein [Streptomyces indicus]|uniref:D-alanyl-D-alanine carboxypeptidase n=1 Tax=Streptomyces indicus TaxID=417292 RepID=A0A1G9HM60_9ACTN|nr:D-alanyl-D-alanine carboxypeptidase family protein [Streptomyces indicus]SDL14058.1 D-alanyl-D-alanine carboxypeptidase [Streptomyces indicus]
MRTINPAPPAPRSRRTPAALALATAALAACVTACQSQPASSSFAATDPHTTPPASQHADTAHPSPHSPSSRPSARDAGSRPLGRADGAVPSGTLLTAEIPALTHLDPALRSALRRAAADAARSGVTIVLNSGWRSPAYQDDLLRKAISQYGSQEEAARWVATSDTSPHVAGKAADLGPSTATSWLSRHGESYGLCQIYRNEPWHYELRPEAATKGCPAMYADPTEDPRMSGDAHADR